MDMYIEMPRGDLRPVDFTIFDDGKPLTDEQIEELGISEIYFTVKRNYEEKKALFQKKYSTGEIEYSGDGCFRFVIEPEDTDGLLFNRDYVFDIEFVGEHLKSTFPGVLHLTPEVTHSVNEV